MLLAIYSKCALVILNTYWQVLDRVWRAASFCLLINLNRLSDANVLPFQLMTVNNNPCLGWCMHTQTHKHTNIHTASFKQVHIPCRRYKVQNEKLQKYINTHAQTRTHAHTHTHTHTHRHTHTNIHTYTHTHTHTHTRNQAHTPTNTHTHMHKNTNTEGVGGM